MSARFQPGMRFSIGDAATLLAAGVFAWWIHADGPWLVHVTAFVVVNFFLFCNVFRIARSSELVWTAAFIVMAGIRLRTGVIEWSTIYLIASSLTIAMVFFEMRRPSYHGLGWKRINPELENWWNRRTGASATAAESDSSLSSDLRDQRPA